MDAHLTFKEQHNRYMKKDWVAEAQLRTVAMILGIVPESVSAVEVASVHAVELNGSKLGCDSQEICRHDALHLLINPQARAILGALPITLRGTLMR